MFELDVSKQFWLLIYFPGLSRNLSQIPGPSSASKMDNEMPDFSKISKTSMNPAIN